MKKILKKVVASITVMSMLLAMGAMTVMANPSGEAGNTTPTPIPPNAGSGGSVSLGSGSGENPSRPTSMGGVTGGTVVVNGQTLPIKMTGVTADVLAAINTTDKLISLLGNRHVRGTTLEVLGAVDASLPDGVVMPAGGIRITFNIAGVQKGDVVKILHQRSTDNVWEVLDATTDNGTVSAEFTSLSPVVPVKVTTPAGGGTNPNKSPTTGRL